MRWPGTCNGPDLTSWSRPTIYSMDTGTAGLRRTASRVESYGNGCCRHPAQRAPTQPWNRFTIRDITVAFAAWTYESGKPHQNRRTINGIPIPVGQEISYKQLQSPPTPPPTCRGNGIAKSRKCGASGADLLYFLYPLGRGIMLTNLHPAQQELASWLAGQGVWISSLAHIPMWYRQLSFWMKHL